jgi:hypothetical protein
VSGGFFAAAAISGQAPAAASGTAAGAAGSIHLRVNLQRFQYDQRHRRLVAHGRVSASYRADGHLRGTSAKSVLLRVQQGTTCRVLHLELGELRLELLGLIVTLTPVEEPNIVLDISADSSEALGKLLCQVIGAVQSGTLAKTTAATRHLNTAIQKKYRGGVLNVDVPLSAHRAAQTTTGTVTATTATPTTTTPAAGQCEVLNLVLGPLNLDLLGLIVQLNKVQLDISANPVGTLGTLFCQLAGSTTLPLTTGLSTAVTSTATGTATTATTATTTTPTTTTTATTTTP